VVYDIEGNEPLTFTAMENGASVNITKDGNVAPISISYSTDGNTWQEYSVGVTGAIQLQQGDTVKFKATTANDKICTSNAIYYLFKTQGALSVTGSVMSLLGPNIADVVSNSCFSIMFAGFDS
jgi:hypothetical protein